MTRLLLEPSDLHGFTAEVEDHARDLAFWLRFEVQRDEYALARWEREARRNSGVCWSGMSGGEKPVMRSDAERVAAAEAVMARQEGLKASQSQPVLAPKRATREAVS